MGYPPCTTVMANTKRGGTGGYEPRKGNGKGKERASEKEAEDPLPLHPRPQTLWTGAAHLALARQRRVFGCLYRAPLSIATACLTPSIPLLQFALSGPAKRRAGNGGLAAVFLMPKLKRICVVFSLRTSQMHFCCFPPSRVQQALPWHAFSLCPLLPSPLPAHPRFLLSISPLHGRLSVSVCVLCVPVPVDFRIEGCCLFGCLFRLWTWVYPTPYSVASSLLPFSLVSPTSSWRCMTRDGGPLDVTRLSSFVFTVLLLLLVPPSLPPSCSLSPTCALAVSTPSLGASANERGRGALREGELLGAHTHMHRGA